MTFDSPHEKQQYVNTIFARIAHRYDMMNRIMTIGQDKYWRKVLVEQARLPSNGILLDVATGTGDIAFEALKQYPNLKQVIGVDFTLPMMRVGQTHLESFQKDDVGKGDNRLSWSGANTLHLPFPDNSFDAVVSGFLMRNVTNLFQALTEQTRVCKPGGRVLILEIPRPKDNLWGTLFRLYFHHVVPFLGGLITGQQDAYAYLPASADAFLRPDELKAEMARAGLWEITYTLFMFNTVALHIGIK